MSMQFPQPPFPVQQQPMPGRRVSMDPLPDYGDHQRCQTEFHGGLHSFLRSAGFPVNCVAPGSVWTPLIPSTMPKDKIML